jgi:hypothetical protein
MAAKGRRGWTAGTLVAAAMALAAPGADAATYDWTYGVAGLQGSITADVSVKRAASGETPALELYGGNATTVISLDPSARPSTPAGRLRGPSGPSSLVLPGRVRFGWNEQASTGAYGTKKRCRGRTAKAVPRRLVQVVRMERQGERIRIRWAIPLPRLGKAGCAGAGTLPTVIAEDTYAASSFDHREIRVRVSGSDSREHAMSGRRTRNVVIGWDFTVRLVRLG